MKTRISELMDGELDDEAAGRLFGSLKNPDTSRDWDTYHLIGDALRGTPAVSTDFATRLGARLAAEPTVLAPRKRPKHNPSMIALSAAASVAAVSIVVWAVLQTNTAHTGAQMIVAHGPETVKASMSVNPYLLAHQEYSPSVAMEGMTPYIRTVSETPEAAAR